MEQKVKYKIVHPALDVVDGILFLGFSERSYDFVLKKWENKNHHIVVEIDGTGNPIIKIINETQIEINNILYVFEPDSVGKQRRLAKVSDRWSEELMRKVKWECTVDKTGLFHNLRSQIQAYLKLEKDEDYTIYIAWIIATYFFPIFNAFPYVHLKGMKNSGKSTGLNLLKLLAFNACKEIATFPAMRDKIDGQRATFLVDQADKKLGTNADGDILDSNIDSYKKSSSKITKNVQVGKGWMDVDFDGYSPKGFASRKDLHFDLRDRLILFTLNKASTSLMELDDSSPVWLELRNELYKLLISNFVNVKNLQIEIKAKYKDNNEIIGRQLELWLPIETVLQLFSIDETLIDKCKKVFKLKHKHTEDTLSNLEWTILEFVKSKLDYQEYTWLELKDIASSIDFGEDSETEIGKEKTPNQKAQHCGNIIKLLNLSSDKGRVGGRGNTQYRFEKQKVLEAYNAYKEKDSEPAAPLTTEKNLVF